MTMIAPDDADSDRLTSEELDAIKQLLWRASFHRLSLPRLCRTRACRRHRFCQEDQPYPPRCLMQFKPGPIDAFHALLDMVKLLLEDSGPVQLPADPVARSYYNLALWVLIDIGESAPRFSDYATLALQRPLIELADRTDATCA
ncbi:hypothetical protein [Rhizobium alvei]|uniref:Uncharacterized protein n=1 Tax=Rhizobium alvei TaxID=1132659 RepID=A0ABT8YHU7_9HYPH|nr:hypothetical protein [Rhizobium alvei]MDO6963228.1 hypothetical protein [Rhizobium alvei]